MRLFNGLDNTDYQDTLRAVGRFCDANGWRNLRIVECDEGMILQYTVGANSREFATYLLSDEDLKSMLRESYTHRRRTAPLRPAATSSPGEASAVNNSAALDHDHELESIRPTAASEAPGRAESRPLVGQNRPPVEGRDR
jgi:hypothetical protein